MIDFNIDGKTLNIDWINGPNASSFVKKIIDAEGCNINRIVGYTVEKLGDASDAVLLQAAKLIAASLGNGWTASITKEGTKRFIIFTR